MRKILIFYLFAVLINSCAIRKNLESGLERAFGALFLPQLGFAKALVESASEIYFVDSIEIGEPIFIRSFRANFVGKIDSFELAVDSIEVTMKNDSVIEFKRVHIISDSIFYSDVSLPVLDTLKSMETISKMRVVSQYWPNANYRQMDRENNCLTASYTLIEKTFSIEEKFNKCREY